MTSNHWGPPEILPQEIETISVLGDGSFGTVCKGRCRAKDVAIKILHQQTLDEKLLQTFRKEVEIVRFRFVYISQKEIFFNCFFAINWKL